MIAQLIDLRNNVLLSCTPLLLCLLVLFNLFVVVCFVCLFACFKKKCLYTFTFVVVNCLIVSFVKFE